MTYTGYLTITALLGLIGICCVARAATSRRPPASPTTSCAQGNHRRAAIARRARDATALAVRLMVAVVAAIGISAGMVAVPAPEIVTIADASQDPGSPDLSLSSIDQQLQFQDQQIQWSFPNLKQALDQQLELKPLRDAVAFLQTLRARMQALRNDVTDSLGQVQDGQTGRAAVRRNAAHLATARRAATELVALTRLERTAAGTQLSPDLQALVRDLTRTVSPEAARELEYALRVYEGFQERGLTDLNTATAQATQQASQPATQQTGQPAGQSVGQPVPPDAAIRQLVSSQSRLPRMSDLAALTEYLVQLADQPVEQLNQEKASREGYSALLRELRKAGQQLADLTARSGTRGLSTSDRRTQARLRARVTQIQQDLAQWRLGGTTQLPVPPKATMSTVPDAMLDPRTGEPLPGATPSTPIQIHNTDTPATSNNPLLWAGAKITRLGQPSSDYHRVFRRSVNPYGGLLPITLSQKAAYQVEMPDGSVYRVNATANFRKVELRSPTEMFRYSGGFKGWPLWAQTFDLSALFGGHPGHPLITIPHTPIGFGAPLIIPRTYVSMEFSVLFPGSDNVYEQPGKVEVDVTMVRAPAGRTHPPTWHHSEAASSKRLLSDNPGPRIAPQHKYDVGVGLLLVIPIYFGEVNVGAIGGVVQLQYTNENKFQTPVAPGTNPAVAIGKIFDGNNGNVWERNVSRELVISQFFSLGGQNPFVPQPGAVIPFLGGFNISGVNVNYVAGQSVGQLPDILRQLAAKIPGFGRTFQDALDQAERQEQAELAKKTQEEAIAQTQARQWLPGLHIQPGRSFPTPVTQAARVISDHKHAVVTLQARYGTRNAPELVIDGQRYGLYQPTTGDIDQIITGLRNKYRSSPTSPPRTVQASPASWSTSAKPPLTANNSSTPSTPPPACPTTSW